MQEAVFVVLLVAVLYYMAYKAKKKKERQMGDELEYLIEKEDWHGVSRILRKQLIIWGCLSVLMTAYVIASFIMGRPKYGAMVLVVVFIWRTVRLKKSYDDSQYNARWKQNEADERSAIEEATTQALKLLGEYNVNATRIRADITPQALKEMWLESRERGRKEGYCPVLLYVDSAFMDGLNDMVADREHFVQWQQQMLSMPVQDGQALLKKQFDANKEDYEQANDWQNDVVGVVGECEAMNDFPLYDFYVQANLLLAEIPVSEPWQVFSYIPFGGWNECPAPEVHMAVAKYWYERYGAEIACIASDNIIYHVSQPVVADAMALAEEQFAYSEDVLQDYGNLATLADMNRKSTVWSIFWD